MKVAVRAWTVVAVLGLAVAPAIAADPPPGRHILSGTTIDPDEIRLVAEFLATTDGSAPKGSIVDEALDLMRRNPGVDYRELANALARKHPELNAPDKFDALFNQFQGLQKLAGPLGTIFPPPSEASRNPAGQESEPSIRDRNPSQDQHSPLNSGAKSPGTTPQNSPNSAERGTGLKPVTPSDKPKSNGSQTNTPSNSFDRGDPTPYGGRFEGGSGRRRSNEHGWEPPGFFENITTEGDMWQARENRAKIEAENRSKRLRQFDAVRGFWESNVGDLDNTPAVKELLRDMFAGPNPIAPDAAEGLLALLGDPAANPRSFIKWASSQGELFDDIARVNPLSRRLGGLNFSGFDSGSSAGALAYQPGAITAEGSWLSVVLFLVVAGGSLLAWRFWHREPQTRVGPQPVPGLGPWPIDPRQISNRADLIRAFEYLSVLICGAEARVAHHLTIADALRKATGSGDAAEPLARGYALARYTPDSEPLPPGMISESREHLCRLAGVAAP